MKLKSDNILLLWKKLAESKSALRQMTKDILTVSVADVDVKHLFFIIWDVITYHWSCFNSDTIVNIIMIKKCDITHIHDIVALNNLQREKD